VAVERLALVHELGQALSSLVVLVAVEALALGGVGSERAVLAHLGARRRESVSSAADMRLVEVVHPLPARAASRTVLGGTYAAAGIDVGEVRTDTAVGASSTHICVGKRVRGRASVSCCSAVRKDVMADDLLAGESARSCRIRTWRTDS
jgi:hypothetical protein